jgi:hypothetical protein
MKNCTLTVKELEEITGKKYAQLKPRLRNVPSSHGEKNRSYYSCKDILAKWASADDVDNELTLPQLQFQRQKAEMILARAKGDKIKFELDVQKGKLIPIEDAWKTVEQLIDLIKSKITNLPPKIVSRYSHLGEMHELEPIAKDLTREMLNELAQAGAEIEESRAQFASLHAPTETDSQPVG